MSDNLNEDGTPKTPSLEDLVKQQVESNKTFQEGMQTNMQEFQATMAQSFQQLTESMKPASADLQDNSQNPPNSDFNMDEAQLEAMPRAKFMEMLTDNIVYTIKKDMFEPMQQSMTKSAATSADDKFRDELQTVKDKNPDFNEWGKELTAILKQSPSMGVADALTLVRAKDPDKVTKLEEKFPPQQSHADSNSQQPANGNNKSFGGMREGNQNSEERRTDMNKEESSNAAWEETMAEIDLTGGSDDATT